MKRIVARYESPACECGRAATLLVRGRRLLKLIDVHSVQSPAACGALMVDNFHPTALLSINVAEQ